MANGVSFVERIDEELDYKGMRRAELLRKIGLPRNAISNWIERGNIPAGDICLKIADELGVSVEYLINGYDKKQLKREQRDLLNQWELLTNEQKETVQTLLKKWEEDRTASEKNRTSKA